MPAEIVSIADAVREELANGDWSLAFTPERHYLPINQLERFLGGELLVTVLPRGETTEAEGRGQDRFDYVVAVIVERKLDYNDDDPTQPSVEDQGDELMALVEEIGDHFRRRARPLASYQAAAYAGMDSSPIYDPARLEEERIFSSVLLLTFRTWREKA